MQQADFDLGGGELPIMGSELAPLLPGLDWATAPYRTTRPIEPSPGLGPILDLAPGYILILQGRDHRCAFANAALRDLLGRPDIVGEAVTAVLARIDGQRFFDALEAVYQTGTSRQELAVSLLTEGRSELSPQTLFIDFMCRPILGSSGEVTGIFVAGYDVTARVHGEERQRLLNHELNHRVKNILATVQALARLLGSPEQSLAEFKAELMSRIQAMAKTQDLLVSGRFEPISVAKLLQIELEPYLGGQVDLRCDEMSIPGDSAVSLGLLVHELLTNAAKYGALSNANGRLSVIGVVAGARGRLIWTESAGRILSPSAASGFGSTMISRLARALGGAASFDLRPDGLQASIEFAVCPA